MKRREPTRAAVTAATAEVPWLFYLSWLAFSVLVLSSAHGQTLDSVSFRAAADREVVAAGGTIRYTIEYRNEGSETLAGLEVVADLDSHVGTESESPAAEPPGSGRWPLQPLAWGEGGSIVIDARIESDTLDGTRLLSRFRIVSSEIEGSRDVDVYTVANVPHPSLALTGSPARLSAGQSLSLTLTYTNAGSAPAYNAEIDLLLDDGLTYESSGLAPANSTNTSLHWNLGTLAPGQGGSIVVTARTDAGAALGTSYRGRATMRSTLDPDPSSATVMLDSASPAATIAECGLRIARGQRGVPRPGKMLQETTLVCDPCAAHEDVEIEVGLADDVEVMRYSPKDEVEEGGLGLYRIVETLAAGEVASIAHSGEVDEDAEHGTLLENETTVIDDEWQEAARFDRLYVHADPQAPLVRLSSPARTGAGKSFSYTLRYGGLKPGATVALVLPADVVLEEARPAPDLSEGARLTWTQLAEGSGTIKVRVQVAAWTGCAFGAEAILSNFRGEEVSRALAATAVPTR